MDVSSFLAGNFLTHLDLPQPQQVWTIGQANQQLVGSDQKVCVTFSEFPAKALGLNKTNLRRIAELYGIDATSWSGQQLQVYRSTTTYSGTAMQCVRVCGPHQATPEAVCDAQSNAAGLSSRLHRRQCSDLWQRLSSRLPGQCSSPSHQLQLHPSLPPGNQTLQPLSRTTRLMRD